MRTVELCAAATLAASLLVGCSSSASETSGKPVTAKATESSSIAPASAPQSTSSQETPMTPTQAPTGFHSFQLQTLEGKPADLGAYRGKVVLVVNTASECGLTPQYKGLEALHQELAPKGFSVLGFPCNDFGGQEPGTPEQIQQFCTSKYSVTFPLFEKVRTKSGSGQSPLYAWLESRTGELPGWNFGKYVVGKDGTSVQFFGSTVAPNAKELRKAIEEALAK